ncbi:MAG: lipopolysaccharide biosynthesis protein [Patescibacteria group bacterium]
MKYLKSALNLLRSIRSRSPVFERAYNLLRHCYDDSLYRNSVYLMMANFTGAGIGFFFWIIAARIYETEEIGKATAIISSTLLLTSISLLGLNIAAIKFLPRSKKMKEDIHTLITTVLIAAVVVVSGYMIGLEYFAQNLLFLRENAWYLLFFLIITIVTALEFIYNSVFIAQRQAGYVFLKSLIGNMTKVVLPFFLISFGAFGVYLSATSVQVVSFVLSGIFLHRLIGYRLRPAFNTVLLSRMFRLSFSNYIASFTAGLPMMLMPIMLNNTLGPRQAAFFYINMMFVNLLKTVQQSTSNSLLAEGSYNSEDIRGYLIKAGKMTLILLVPLILFIVFFGKYILLAFGREYSVEGVNLLRMLAVSVIFTSINGMLSAVLNIKGRANLILLMCIIGPLILLSLIYFALPHGLVALGLAWLVGEALIALIYVLLVTFIFKLL